MIYIVNGRPGSGKSLTVAEYIYKAIRRGKTVVANFDINMDYFSKCRHPEKLGQFINVTNEDLMINAYKNIDPRRQEYSYLNGFMGLSLQFFKRNKKNQIIEKQALIVLDECADLFNCRTYNARDRLSWCQFFRQHRKYGYDVYLVAQNEGDIDKQIRELLECEIECRCVNNYKLFGRVLGFLCGGRLFVRIFRNLTIKANSRSKTEPRNGAKYFTGRKYYDFYDSYKLFG